jgi:hypothetical protein
MATLTSIRAAQSMGLLPDDDFVSVRMRDDFRLFGNVECRDRGYEMSPHIEPYVYVATPVVLNDKSVRFRTGLRFNPPVLAQLIVRFARYVLRLESTQTALDTCATSTP